MKTARFTLLLVLLLAATAQAQCPDAMGQWSTTNGTMLGGRASEAWCGAGGYPVMAGVPGNTQSAHSFDGGLLGTQWRAWGMAVDDAGAVLIADTVTDGSGARTYQTHYLGGQFWLSRDEAWADGLADLTGNLDSYQVITTVTYFGGVAVGATSNITFGGSFENCAAANGCEISFTIANAILAWRPDFPTPMPADYPPFLCDATTGELFDVCCITLQIDCAVPHEATSWSELKAIYR